MKQYIIVIISIFISYSLLSSEFDKGYYYEIISEQNNFKEFKKITEQYKNDITPIIKAEALGIACSFESHDRYEFINYLVSNMNADINMKVGNIGYTPFLYSIQDGDIKTIKFLISKGADINTRSNNNTTPLMIASARGYTDIVTLLLKHKADYNIKNDKGDTALSLARKLNNDDIVKILHKAGAKE